MAINWKQLSQSVLSATASVVYTAPANTQTSIQAAQAWNPTGSAVIVDVFIAPALGSAADATHVDRVQVPAASAAPIYGLINQKMTAAMQLYALGNGVTLTTSGSESA